MFVKADKYLKKNFFGYRPPPQPLRHSLIPPLLPTPLSSSLTPPFSWVAKLLAEHSELFLKASD
jgi:hypothetical protein